MYQLSENDINAVLQYLGSRPYGEVFQLVPLLQGAEKIEPPVNEPATVEGEVVDNG